MSKALDLVIVYKIIKYLNTNWEKWDAYKLGIIDKKGRKLKDTKTPEEKAVWTPFIRLMWRLRYLITKVGGQSKVSTVIGTYLLLKEELDSYKDAYGLNEEHIYLIAESVSTENHSIKEQLYGEDNEII